MLPFFGSAAIVIAALTSSATAAASVVAQAAPVAAPATATTPSQQRRHGRQTAVAQTSVPDSDAQAIEDQNRLRVLMPALSGDGGG